MYWIAVIYLCFNTHQALRIRSESEVVYLSGDSAAENILNVIQFQSSDEDLLAGSEKAVIQIRLENLYSGNAQRTLVGN